jgi:glycine/D-amino acid oxidase-like deaminating enzyme
MSVNGSLWSEPVNLHSFERVAADAEVDVLVVGGGITGVSAALLLASSGKRVMLVEARRIGSGVTGDSTVHLSVTMLPAAPLPFATNSLLEGRVGGDEHLLRAGSRGRARD